jgi:aldehyde dehydrogenase (NAD+)
VSGRDVERFFVGGEWVEPSGDGVEEILNPATEEVIARAAVPTPKDAARAIEAARVAFDEGPWPRMPVAERAAALRRVREVLHERRRDLADLMIDQVGSTVLLAKTFQGRWPIEAFSKAADWAEAFAWEREPEPATDPLPVRSLLMHEPVGVVSAITPFNFPFFVNAWKVAVATAMGNTVVLKPAPWTPLDAFEIARAAEEAELPPGVVNVIGGGGVDVGEELVSNPMVDMVSFTGSVPAGRSVGALAAQTIKKVQLELGGKSPLFVLDDASPSEVVMNAVAGCMIHAGQGCGCTTRLLLPQAMHDAVVEQLVETCRNLPVGDPRDPNTQVGPLIRERHRERVEAYVQAGIDEGATLAAGGGRPAHLQKGFFFEPTVFTGVRNDMRIAQEEIFGPVLCVIPYATEDEGVAIANDSDFGLGGAVVSSDRERARAIARRLRTGYVGLGVAVPNFNGSWGGYRQSGVGREWREGLAEYTEVKHISWVEA